MRISRPARRLPDRRRRLRRDGARPRPRARRRGALRRGGPGRLRLQLLEGLRDDGLAARLRGRLACARGRPAQAAGAGGVVPERGLAEGGRGGSARARRTSSPRCETRTASGAIGPGSSCRERGLPRVSDAGHLLHASSDVSEAGLASMDFTLRLLHEWGVAVAPGEVFGPGGEGLVRVSLARGAGRPGRGPRRGSATRCSALAAAPRMSDDRAAPALPRRARRASSSSSRRALIATPSVNPPGDERARRGARSRAARGARHRRRRGARRPRGTAEHPGRACRARARGRTLMLCGHLDTKPPGDLEAWRTDPWDPVDRGRRASRARLGRHEGCRVAAMVYAAGALVAAGLPSGRLVAGARRRRGGRLGARRPLARRVGPAPWRTRR